MSVWGRSVVVAFLRQVKFPWVARPKRVLWAWCCLTGQIDLLHAMPDPIGYSGRGAASCPALQEECVRADPSGYFGLS